MDKKGAELTMNVIIIAILALIVLAVMAFIFAQKAGLFSTGIKDCASLQGTCSGEPRIVNDKVVSIDCKGTGAPVLGTNCENSYGCCVKLV